MTPEIAPRATPVTPLVDRVDLLTFRVGSEEFCVEVIQVREIRVWARPTPLPNAPAALSGVINLRGIVLPVVDLASLLGLASAESGARAVIIVVELNGRTAGLTARSVQDIVTLPRRDIGPPPAISADAAPCLSGLALHEGRFLRILDLAALLPGPQGAL